jgi:diguanylate cyclase (GGDEF)-like protein/PAS domain S-box-containing protein
MWHSLIANFAVGGLFIVGWLQAQEHLGAVKRRSRRLLFGLVMGLASIGSMFLSIELQPGVIIDLRTTFVAVSAFIGGPYAGLVTALMTAAYRLGIGGAGAWVAMIGVALSLIVGLIGHSLIHRRSPTLLETVVFSAITAGIPLVSMSMLPSPARESALAVAGVPISVLGFVSSLIVVTGLSQSRHRIEERKLLLAAFKQAPDFLFVKDRLSRFAVVNNGVAEVNGFDTVEAMRGKTDFDIAPKERAQRLFADEQRIMATGTAILNAEELVEDEWGAKRWYLTSKTALQNVDGEVLGLAGVTRDITDRKDLEKALLDSRNELNVVLTGISDGLARFDASGRLMFCNQRYQDLFPLTGALRVSGAMLSDILAAAVERGEQLDIPVYKVKSWIGSVIGALVTGGEEEVRLFDGRWLHVRTNPIVGAGATVVVSDITTMKRAELGLLAVTERLKVLADTDALTGLANRRSFDDQLEKEILRSRRNMDSLSLVMIDIDHFKSFNDRYGHPAGDDCLRRVARAIKESVRRPADVVARYGGEELALILPDTEEAGAFEVAEAVRRSVEALHIEHIGSVSGFVTISLGVATSQAPDDIAASLLLDHADEALYIAKGAGRNRVMGWSPRHERRAV